MPIDSDPDIVRLRTALRDLVALSEARRLQPARASLGRDITQGQIAIFKPSQMGMLGRDLYSTATTA
jgi:hypothetical protein